MLAVGIGLLFFLSYMSVFILKIDEFFENNNSKVIKTKNISNFFYKNAQ